MKQQYSLLSDASYTLSLWRYHGGLVLAEVFCTLPGAEPYRHAYRADAYDLQEGSAWHDDVVNEIKVWAGLTRCVVDDWTNLQQQLLP